MVDIDAALTFLTFVGERHRVWERRQAGEPQPWTVDPVLATRKFTNVFRVLDPGSQFVLTDLLEPDLPSEEFLARCFLYRHTNLPEAWRAYRNDTGSYPLLADLRDLEEFWVGYRDEGGGRVFSGAYMIYPQSSTPGTDKVHSIVDLTRRLFTGEKIQDEFLAAKDQRSRFAVLRRNKGVADFMSMQILTDFGYSTEFREDEFVVPGPGARKGAAALGMKGEEAIEWAHWAMHRSEDCPMLWHNEDVFRPHWPSRMDVQNCLCEFSKYVRFASSPSPQRQYSPAHPGVQLAPALPPHW